MDMPNVKISDGPLIEARDLTRIYGDGEQIFALNKVNLRIASGEFVAVIGPSGSGKSTLLNMIGALDRPTRGEVFISGQPLSEMRDLDSFRAKTVGFIFQLYNLIPTLTARENVEVPMMGQIGGRSARRERAAELLHMVGLGERMDHLPNQLSGGQRQRVAIARALANQPSLVLADEPTGDLDTQSGAEIIALMRDLNHDLGTTFIIVTHDPAVARQTERILAMRDGRIVHEHQVGTPYEEDLAAFRRSELGRAIISEDSRPGTLDFLERQERDLLRRLLENAP
jgi:putative ABC transport system ATP-binding protein